MDDEHKFRKALFMETQVFSQRMQYLTDKKYNVITLQNAYNLKQAGNFPNDSIVITIDDGFYSVLNQALPVLLQHNFPSTLYVTSYYCNRNSPIFNIAVSYIFFKTTKINIVLDRLNINGVSEQNDENIVNKIVEYGNSLKSEKERIDLLIELGELLEVDYYELNESRKLNLITFGEIKELLDGQMDIQLHTHRHSFPEDESDAYEELEKNKQKINPFLPKDMTHFCYPSGNWSEKHWPILEKHKILTATTCEPKLVDYDTPDYSLNRILDDGRVSQIEFEAEVSGFNEIIRMMRK